VPLLLTHPRATRFVYSDDDMVATSSDVGLDFWWEAPRAEATEGGAQILFQGLGEKVARTDRTNSNAWDQALVYMAGLLDEVAAGTGATSGGAASTGLSRGTADVAAEGHPKVAPRDSIARIISPHVMKRAPLVGYYAPPVHMPVLFNVRVLWEMEQRWPRVFARTRAHRRRHPKEMELNFLYHHYVRLLRYPTATHAVRSFRVGYHRIEKCGLAWGAAACNASLSNGRYNFVCFNDETECAKCYRRGVRQLHRFMSRRFGTFGSDHNAQSLTTKLELNFWDGRSESRTRGTGSGNNAGGSLTIAPDTTRT